MSTTREDLCDVVDKRRPDPNGETRKGFERHWKNVEALTAVAGAANENAMVTSLLELPAVKMFAYMSYCQGVDDLAMAMLTVLRDHPEMLALFEKRTKNIKVSG